MNPLTEEDLTRWSELKWTISNDTQFIAESRTALPRLIEEVRRLKQGIWDMARVTGVDQDGQKTLDALAYPDIVTYGLKAVTDLRESYDEALEE